MNKYRIVEFVCVILSLVFVFSSVKTETQTTKTAEELTEILISEMNSDSLLLREREFIRDRFGIDLSLFSSVIYYSSDDVMEVSELFIGVLNGEESSVSDAFSKYVTDRFNLFNGYAPEQTVLLDDYILDISSGVLIFCVSENADAVLSAFNRSVKGE